MPEIIKNKVNKMISTHALSISANRKKEIRNAMSASVLEDIYMNVMGNKIDQVFVDLDTSIKNIAKRGIKDVDVEARKKYHNTFVNQFPKMAEQCREEDPTKADLLLKISDGYNQAHSLEKMYDMYKNTGKLRVKKFDIDKINRYITDFNYKYETSKFTIKDISTADIILDRHVNKCYDMKYIKALIVIFCKYTANMKPTNIDDHTFMYYFITNIVTLDIYDKSIDEDNKYYSEFINSIEKFLDLIQDKLPL